MVSAVDGASQTRYCWCHASFTSGMPACYLKLHDEMTLCRNCFFQCKNETGVMTISAGLLDFPIEMAYIFGSTSYCLHNSQLVARIITISNTGTVCYLMWWTSLQVNLALSLCLYSLLIPSFNLLFPRYGMQWMYPSVLSALSELLWHWTVCGVWEWGFGAGSHLWAKMEDGL